MPLHEQLPAIALSFLVLLLGLAPDLLVGMSQAATTGLSELTLVPITGGLS